MKPTEIYPNLISAVDRIVEHILKNKNAKLISRIVSQNDIPKTTNHVTNQEAAHRQKSLEEFQKLPLYQKTSAQSYNAFIQSLFPARNGLSQLKASQFMRKQVNHSTLYKRYTDLPSPGVGHLRSEDLEEFMAQMIQNRVFSKPNVLSSSTVLTYNDEYLIKQYRNGLNYRKEHLRKLWHITRDMEEAGIPLTDYERRQMVYLTFYRDRPDIVKRIQTCQAHLNGKESEFDLEDELPQFQWETYSNLLALDPLTYANIEFHNTLLFCALRHKNWHAEKSLLNRIGSENFSRNTYKILLDNHAMHGRIEPFSMHLDALSSRHLHLLDIQLLNLIIRSVSALGYPELSERLVLPFFEHDGESLEDSEKFLRLSTFSDRKKYSLYLRAYDQKYASNPIKFFATERTFLPLLEYYCVSGADFSRISNLLFYLEVGWGVPFSSVMFGLIFRAFTSKKYDPADLQVITMKLIEQHDRYNDSSDSWVKERINQTSIPENATKTLLKIIGESALKHLVVEDGTMLKLSNGLMRLIFKAFYTTYKDDTEKIKKISAIETNLQNEITEATSLNSLRMDDELQPADLNQRSELTYLKKTSILELLDI